MSTIHAIFEDGLFRPREPVGLPEGSEVEFEPRIVRPDGNGNEAQTSVYELLSMRFESGEHDVADLHNEHQP
jgi:predicted DNA-binding antitoxin AbrB/MazE fold protein